MSLNSPIFKKIMSSYSPDMNETSVAERYQGSSLAANPINLSPNDQGSSLAQPSLQGQDIRSQPELQVNPTGNNTMMNTLWDVETKGGTISDRPGSQYKGIGQLGDNVRKPLLKKYGYTEEQYANSIDIQKEISTAHIDSLRKRMGSDADNLDLWGGHNMGVEGWRQIKSGKVSPGVLRNLRNQKGMNANSTPQDYIDYYAKIFR